MRILATTLLCLLLSTQICRAQDDAPKAAKASVTGTVLRTDLNQPVADADVILAPETSTWDRTVSVTDSKGSFTFSGLPAGSYRLRVSKPRFVMPSPQLQAEGYRMEVAEGQQLAGVDLKISTGGVVTGKVLDEQGEPVIGATIKLLLPRYKPAGSTLEAATSAQTNDLGEYRLFGISPGRYYLVVHPPGTSKQELSSSRESRAARATTYRRMYYDNALLERDARPLTVAAGTEVSVDFSLTKVRTATVHLTLAIPKKFSDPQGYLGIVPVDSSLLETLEYSDLTGDLSCTFKDVMPGHYVIGGIVEDRQRKDDKEFFGVGAQEIDVAEGLNEVHVPVTSFSAYLTGHIRFDSEKHPPVADLKVFYAPLRGEFAILEERNGEAASVDDAGEFDLDVRTTVRIAVGLRAQSKEFEDFYLKSVLVGGRETLTTGILPTARGHVEIVVGSDGGILTGHVLDFAGKPVAGSTVVALADAEHRKTFSCTDFQKTDFGGRFTLRGICPGHYSVLALPPEAPDDIFWDPDFVKRHEELGVPLNVAPKSKQSFDLQPIKLRD